ncbi:MAG: hypothetical protein AB7V42_10490 [Thermoleophilia bacterium]
MTNPPSPEAALGPEARESLARGLDLVEAHTDAPVRLRGHSSARGHRVFDLQEEFEVGPLGRRFLVSVGGAGDAVLLTMTAAA